MSIVLGIDPGLASTGYGFIRKQGGGLVCLTYGVIKTESTKKPQERLLLLYRELNSLIGEYKPVLSGMETLFFGKNVTSALPVAQARGVILLALAEHSIPVFEFSPNHIKQSVIGQGKADKLQMQKMIQIIFGLQTLPTPDHAADALGAAIACAHGRMF